jgi:hypothetical protein
VHVHLQSSTVTLKSSREGDVEWEIKGCCDEHKAALLRRDESLRLQSFAAVRASPH